MPKRFSMSIIWKSLTELLLSLSLTFIALVQNQVEWIFQLMAFIRQPVVFMTHVG